MRHSRTLFVAVAGVALLACSPASPLGQPTPAPVASAAASPTATPTLAPSATPSAVTRAGVAAKADVNGAPFTGAAVTVYQLGYSTPLATGTTDANGAFLMDLGTKVTDGTPLKLVASKGDVTLLTLGPAGILSTNGSNILSTNGSNIVAQGGGNIVAQGGGNIVAQGGGNIVAQGGGNIVAQGGGNIVAQGGGNYGLLDSAATAQDQGVVYKMSLSTTLAVILLGPAYEHTGISLARPDGSPVNDQVVNAILSFAALEKSVSTFVQNNPDTAALIGASVSKDGTHTALDAKLSARLTADPAIQKAITATQTSLTTTTKTSVAAGGVDPDKGSTGSTGSTTTTSGNGGSGGGGAPGTSNATVNLTGNLNQPSFGSSGSTTSTP